MLASKKLDARLTRSRRIAHERLVKVRVYNTRDNLADRLTPLLYHSYYSADEESTMLEYLLLEISIRKII